MLNRFRKNLTDDIFLLGIETNYASPGFTDFMGLAAIIEQLKEILMHYIPNKKQEEECRILEQKRIELQIKNLKNMGFSSL